MKDDKFWGFLNIIRTGLIVETLDKSGISLLAYQFALETVEHIIDAYEQCEAEKQREETK